MVAAAALRLLEDAGRIPFRGWDFSVLGDRLMLEPPPWSFEEIVDECAAVATSMLDMGTGGGEWLSSRRHPRLTVATESWLPNAPIAASRLRPLGIAVVQDEGAVDNVDQRPGNARGRLAFREAAFDLVMNRHEAFYASEVRRVLRPGGTFVTQQTSSGSRQFHELLGLDRPTLAEFDLERAVAQLDTVGFEIERAEAGTVMTVFADIGALAWYLTNMPWAVPGFDTATFKESLLRLHGRPIRVPSSRFVIRARA
jgi:SAM-dependent methyltransferase